MDNLGAEGSKVVENRIKQQEIEEAKRAVRRRQEKGYYQHREWFSLEFDDTDKCLTSGRGFRPDDDRVEDARPGMGVKDETVEVEIVDINASSAVGEKRLRE